MHRIGRMWFEGTEGQNLSRTRGSRMLVQGKRGRGPSVRDIAYGGDYEGIMSRLLCYSLPLKILWCG